MFEFCSSVCSLAGKISLIVIKNISISCGLDPQTVLGGIVLGSGIVVTTYFIGPAVLTVWCDTAGAATEAIDQFSQSIDWELPNSYRLTK